MGIGKRGRKRIMPVEILVANRNEQSNQLFWSWTIPIDRSAIRIIGLGKLTLTSNCRIFMEFVPIDLQWRFFHFEKSGRREVFQALIFRFCCCHVKCFGIVSFSVCVWIHYTHSGRNQFHSVFYAFYPCLNFYMLNDLYALIWGMSFLGVYLYSLRVVYI